MGNFVEMWKEMIESAIDDTDGYKFGQYKQVPETTQYMSSYIEARGGKWHNNVFFGLQMYLMQYLTEQITMEAIDEMEEFCPRYGAPFNKEGWEYIVNEHDGYLPVEIQAIPEGTIIPCQNVMAQIVNTDPKCYWLPDYLESALLRAVWYPSTVATLSYHVKLSILEALEKSGTPEQFGFKMNDFGLRAGTSRESSAIGGCAHLTSSMGSDTTTGVRYVDKFYNGRVLYPEFAAGMTIPASQHSVIAAWGRLLEKLAFKNIIVQFSEKYKLIACVSDTYDIFNAIRMWKELEQDILDSGATIVIRPDSGEPIQMSLDCLNLMMELFGYTVNEKGYKVLPPHVRMIYGDGINDQSIQTILNTLMKNGISIDNIAFGMGGKLLQDGVTRDTQGYAMKGSAIVKENGWEDSYKDPITDVFKVSKKGRLALIKENNEFRTIREDELGDRENLLIPVFRNGKILTTYDFEEVRRNSNFY